jgi:hypothetical protein
MRTLLSILSKVVGSEEAIETVPLMIGITESEGPICPHCKTILKKFPKRTVACTGCGEQIFVTKRPADGLPVLLTKKELQRIKDEKRLIADANLRKKYKMAERELASQFSSQPNHFDIMWRVYNEYLIAQTENGESLRGTHIEMVELCFAEDNFKASLRIIIEMCIEDITVLFLKRRDVSQEVLKLMKRADAKALSPEVADIAGGLLYQLAEALKKSGQDLGSLEPIFLQRVNAISPNFWTKINSDSLWKELKTQFLSYSQTIPEAAQK